MEPGIDASVADWALSLYPGGHVGGCMPIAPMGWMMAAPPVVVIAERLAAHQGEFLQTRWLMAGLSVDDPRVGRRLFQLRRHHGLSFVEGGRVVCVPPAVPDEWEPAKAKILGLIRGAAPVGYTAIRARAGLSEASLQTVLQALANDRCIEVSAPGGPEAWATMAFTRVQGP
jgi:hypothetical protein